MVLNSTEIYKYILYQTVIKQVTYMKEKHVLPKGQINKRQKTSTVIEKDILNV